VTFEKQRKMAAPAAYYCTKKSVPLQLVYHDLIEIGLNNSISFLQPGHESKVRFYQEDLFMGQQAEFEVDNHKPLNSFLYDDRSTTNDRVKSLVFVSYAMNIPATCEDLNFNKKAMQLNMQLMKEGGKFFAKSNPKNYALKGFQGPLELNRIDHEHNVQYVPDGGFEAKEFEHWKSINDHGSSSPELEKMKMKSAVHVKGHHSEEGPDAHSHKVVEKSRAVKRAADKLVEAKKAVANFHASHIAAKKPSAPVKKSSTPAVEAKRSHSSSPKPAVHQHSADWFKAHPDYAKKVGYGAKK